MNYKKGFIETIALVTVGILALIAGGVTYYNTHKTTPQFTAGAFNPTGGGTYRLQSSIGTSNTSIRLTSFKEPVSGIPYTMSYLNSSIQYGTIDPQTTYKEFVSFTGITQNADGSATLTGVTRGLGFSYPYTASTTLAQSHSGQSIFILSNPPQLTNQYAAKANDETIAGLWTFTQTPIGINPGGQPNASESVIGVSQLATQLQMASSTALGSTGGAVVLQAKYATSSPYTTGLYVPITRNDGKLNPNFIATSSSDFYNFATMNIASSTLASTTAYTINAGNINATSTIRANSFVGNGSSLTGITVPRYVLIDNTDVGITSSYATSTYAITIPANTLNASSTIEVKFTADACLNTVSSGACYIALKTSTGAPLVNFVQINSDATSYTGDPAAGWITIGSNNSSTFSSQIYFGASQSAQEGTPTSFQVVNIEGTSNIDFTSAVTLRLVTKGDTNTTGNVRSISVVVNP